MNHPRGSFWGVCLFALICLSPALCKQINVPAQYKTIQAAIDASIDGDIIVVAQGTYKERINFRHRRIKVRSSDPTNKSVVAGTIIDGEKLGVVVTFNSGERETSVLAGLTITNGSGILCSWGSSPTINNNIISNHSASGVQCSRESSPILTKNTITGNVATYYGGGVFCESSSSPVLTNNIIRDNRVSFSTGSGGGIACLGNCSPVLTGNVISGNRATYGAGLYCYQDSSPTLTGNAIRGNIATRGGGLYLHTSSPALRNNTITGNSAALGAGMYCYFCSSEISGNTIGSNTASDRGGGISCDYSSPNITGNAIRTNTATGAGGAIFCLNHSSPAISGNEIRGNSAAQGGGLCCAETNSCPAIAGNVIRNNTATDGGGLYCAHSAPLVTNNVISGNRATRGGAVCVLYYQTSPRLVNNTIASNWGDYGGGILCGYAATPIIKNCIVAFNDRGGGLQVARDSDAPSRPIVTFSDFFHNVDGEFINFALPPEQKGNMSRNPLFANLSLQDFHLKSTGGRWNPLREIWTTDSVHSPCIDRGSRTSPYALEPAPNGGRINMGAYGNTSQASKSAAPPAPTALTLRVTATPARCGTQLSLTLSSAASVSATVCNLAGRTVAVLPKRDLPEGLTTLLWDGRSSGGTRVPAGRYLIRVTARTVGGSQSTALGSITLR